MRDKVQVETTVSRLTGEHVFHFVRKVWSGITIDEETNKLHGFDLWIPYDGEDLFKAVENFMRRHGWAHNVVSIDYGVAPDGQNPLHLVTFNTVDK